MTCSCGAQHKTQAEEGPGRKLVGYTYSPIAKIQICRTTWELIWKAMGSMGEGAGLSRGYIFQVMLSKAHSDGCGGGMVWIG